MARAAEYLNLPFDAAIQTFRSKLNLPTQRWDDLWSEQHARAFVVAGATRQDLLCDLRGAVDKTLAEGKTLADFRKEFTGICQRRGWEPRGGKAWRASVIYNTNLSTAYAAGHYQAMTSPAVLQARPYWRYLPSSSVHPRPEHMAWYNVVLPANHPWWNTHYSPNGWGCKCGVGSLDAAELAELEAAHPAGSAHPVRREAPPMEMRSYTNRRTGEVMQIPRGIDPGWDYNPGKAAWGERLSKEAMDGWAKQGADAWERLSPGDASTFGRPARLPLDTPSAPLGPATNTAEDVEATLTDLMDGPERVYSLETDGWRHDILVNAATLARHVDPARGQYLPLLLEALTDPYEVWLSFERHRGTGRVEIRQRVVKAVAPPSGKDRGLLVVAQAIGGMLEAWTMLPVRQLAYLNRQRVGRLVYGR